MGIFPRKADDKLASFPRTLTPRLDRSAMELDEVADQSEPDAEAPLRVAT